MRVVTSVSRHFLSNSVSIKKDGLALMSAKASHLTAGRRPLRRSRDHDLRRAMIGGAIGSVVHTIFPDTTATPGAYALVGMAAFFAGVSRATLTAMIILFEMTLSYNIIIPLMFACVISDAIAWSFYPDSIYTKKLRQKGIRFFQDMGQVLVLGGDQ